MITPSDNPLRSLEEWDDDVLRRYPESSSQPGDQKDVDDFRVYDDETPQHVQDFYRANHRNQTVEFNRQQRDKYLELNQRRMSIWEAMDFLNTLVDESDPDTDLTQIQHLLQTSEAIRADGHPRWFILTGLVHDLGKILCLFGEPQWAVTGDTYPVGCAFSDSIVYPEFFLDNPDQADPRYASRCGIYEQGGGLQQVMLSWGHDEYLYHVVKEYLPAPGLAMIRYHSFYPWHHDGAYRHLMNEQDHQMLEWVKRFNPYDLYSKSDVPPDVDQLRPYYQELISEFFPQTISW
jgi:inositol oxygenase